MKKRYYREYNKKAQTIYRDTRQGLKLKDLEESGNKLKNWQTEHKAYDFGRKDDKNSESS